MELLNEIIKAIILGIVQGITEWLPISSTGHMILIDEFLHLAGDKEFVDLFLVVVQLGSILAVVLMYFDRLNPFSKRKSITEKKQTWDLWGKILIACVPAGIVGVLFNDQIKEWFFNPQVIAFTLIIYGIGFILIERRKRRPEVNKLTEITPLKAAGIGVFQMLALIPGTSRSGATIMGSTLLGLNRKTASEFSFFLAIPVMFGASLLDLVRYRGSLELINIIVLLVGMFTAFIVSIFAIKMLLSYIRKHSFEVFGYYRIVLGILVILYFIIWPLFK
ncbi:MAG: undecaprenyl-diphosphate phosphatase [Traorella sp.]